MWVRVDFIDRNHVNSAFVVFVVGFDWNKFYDDRAVVLEVSCSDKILLKWFDIGLN
jgi:hypothetical protein